PMNKGEYYLTDAFQYMIDRGARIQVIDVEGWYDAGKIETLLDTNRVMLEKGRARRPSPPGANGSTVIDPVYVEEGVVLENARIGPNVSLGAGSVVRSSQLRDVIVGRKSRIVDSSLHDSLLGDEVIVEGVQGEVTLGDHSEVRRKG
ncbi:MAG: sugar phosphate nucleotidyltransferase, partial [Gemmatimonadaceae bacterium]